MNNIKELLLKIHNLEKENNNLKIQINRLNRSKGAIFNYHKQFKKKLL